jgi:hypothetical protein
MRRRTKVGPIGAMLLLALASTTLFGCNPEPRAVPPVNSGAALSEATTRTVTPAWLRSEAASLTARSDVDLVPMQGAQAWLGGEGFEAYDDRVTNSEFIIDLTRRRVLSFVAPGGLDRPESELATVPGEPAREVVLQGLDRWIAAHAKDLEDPSLRRTVTRIDHGELMTYGVLYQKYVNGVAVPPGASVTVSLPYSDWKPSYSLHRYPGRAAATTDPKVSMRTAIGIARRSAHMPDARLTAAEVKSWLGGFDWFVELDNSAHVPKGSMGNRGSTTTIDAMTGKVLSRGGY